MRLENPEVLRHAEHYLHLLSASELSLEEKHALIQETVHNYATYYNRGFISYRKSVTEAGQFAGFGKPIDGTDMTAQVIGDFFRGQGGALRRHPGR